MKISLLGPFPLDLGAVGAAARQAFEALGVLGESGAHPLLREASARSAEPGLYLILYMNPRPEIYGFWLLFGNSWLDGGPSAGPERAPPFVSELLAAATEAVWWRLLPVWPRAADTWTPLFALEWPPALASRASQPPPGVIGGGTRAPGPAHDDGGWMEEDRGPAPAPRAATVEEEEEAELPARRSLFTLARGRLERVRGAHRGHWQLLCHEQLHDGISALGLEDWLAQVADLEPAAPVATAQTLGPPLRLGHQQVGFPLDGWLLRSLDLWPPSPADLQPARLPERDVGSRWRAWIGRTVLSTAAVLGLTLGLATGVHLAARPQPELAPAPPPLAAQPAMSVCSADHQAFVAELRCQVAWFAGGGAPETAVCGDRGAASPSPTNNADLQAAWCGLTDRDLDAVTVAVTGGTWSDLAAARACYNVLGHPYPYETPAAPGAPRQADPDRFLRSRDLGIRALAELVTDLDQRCEANRARLSAQVEGAIFATSIGAAMGEAAALRDSLSEGAIAARSPDQARCFQAGAQEGVLAAQTYADLCGGGDTPAPSKAWQALAGVPDALGEASVARRYTDARFGKDAVPSAAPWGCHVALANGTSPGGSLAGRWDLALPVPTRYDVAQGLVRSQLTLDAGLRAILEDGLDPGACWGVVQTVLSRYTPVYPLLATPDPGAWPSEEQQLCGQVCAVWGRLRSPPLALAVTTLGTDLALCTSAAAPDRAEGGPGALDRLRLPWNDEDRAGWKAPTAAEICAFNLLAQGYFPPDAGILLPDKLSPAQWAGSTTAGSGLAGGVNGVAADGAKSLSSYGRTRSVRTCGAVAAQCFTTGVLRVTSDAEIPAYQWPDRWEGWLRGVAEARPEAIDSPWCGLIQPFLRLDGSLPEGQLDYPCIRSVDEARRGTEAQLAALAAGAATGRTP